MYYLWSCIGVLILLSLPLEKVYAQPIAVNGNMDLSTFQIGSQKTLELNGEWGFYWNELLDPSAIQTTEHKTNVEFPHLWSDDPNLPSFGYAT
jgi:hypothetical protein